VILLPFIYIGLVGLVLHRAFGKQLGGGDVGKRRRVADSDRDDATRFAQIGGIAAAKMQVMEVVDFLRNPERFTRVGAKVPKGILLAGPPGTGKTMLARAVATEACLPFFSASGSDFVQVYAGLGAARVRELFKKARAASPCILFIDEVDALGKSRGSEISMNDHDERDQTLNMLLSQMDGFDGSEKGPILVIAATNRINVLDAALTRPGRFDRIVRLELPDEAGRLEILKVHTSRVQLAASCAEQMHLVAQLTPGLAGAGLANLVNEAAITAVGLDCPLIEIEHFFAAVERTMVTKPSPAANANPFGNLQQHIFQMQQQQQRQKQQQDDGPDSLS
jgi:cell division protease FtsH